MADVTRIILKILKEKNKPQQQLVAEVILGRLNEVAIKIIDIPTGHTIICQTNEDR